MTMTARVARYNRRVERPLPVELHLVETGGEAPVHVPPSAPPSRLGAAALCCMMAGGGIWVGIAYAFLF
jgi:hypothetical protein